MEQVSPEVKEVYLNNLTYTTINKKDWKVLNREYNNVTNKQNKFMYSMIFLSFVIAFIVSITAIIFYNVSIMFFAFSSVIPLIIVAIEEKYCIFYDKLAKRKRFLHNYKKANDTFNVLIEGNDRHRYYSRWYLELINPKVEVYEPQCLRIGLDEKKRYIHFNEIGKTVNIKHDIYGYQRFQYDLHPVTRHPDRFNWRNTLSTNRVLSIKEYKNLIKSKEEFKKYMDMEEDIREFQEYNGL